MHPCQKQPSMNTARCDFGKTKSGFPINGYLRRQPFIPYSLNNLMVFNSVDLFPRLLTLAIIIDLAAGDTVSTIIEPESRTGQI